MILSLIIFNAFYLIIINLKESFCKKKDKKVDQQNFEFLPPASVVIEDFKKD
jgi:hypothetical protein